jgi:hypothetical protein
LNNGDKYKYLEWKVSLFREYDKKMLSFRPGFKYLKEVLENSYEWHKLVPELNEKRYKF